VPHTPLADERSLLAFRYDVVIVGSGYGGSITAARLAAKGRSVCILERGREWAPGDFPTNELAVMQSLRTSANPLGLLDANVQVGNDLDVVVANGLGGTSLINAGIALRPESDVFEQPQWPRAIRDAWHDGSLSDYYARAEAMLAPVRHEPMAGLPKLRTHRDIVTARNVKWGVLPLAVTRDAHARHGVHQPACTHCGNCVAGCNVGAKNALTTNYLPHAKQRGARIFTGIEVTHIERSDAAPGDANANYTLHFTMHQPGVLSSSRHGSVRAKTVVLSAGSMGSTEILLRSQTPSFRFSPRLGERFSANADILGFSYNGDARSDAIGYDAAIQGIREGWPVGTSLSSFGDFRGAKDLDERFLLIEGAVPAPLAKLAARAVGAWALAHVTQLSPQQRARTMTDLAPLAEPGPDGALNHSLLLLACGHDSGRGRLVLRKPEGRVEISWPGVEDERCFPTIQREMEAYARSHGGMFVPNPRSTVFGGARQMTVHPLGGAAMGDTADDGAVDDEGCVFAADGGRHVGLYVADGAIVPRSVGVTPLLTISALSERIAERLARRL
jgi:cholesterol oxidase